MSPRAGTVFLVNFEFPPISGPGIWRVLGFARYLASRGYRIDVFCSDRPTWHARYDDSMVRAIPAVGTAVHRISSLFPADVATVLERWRRGLGRGALAQVVDAARWRWEAYYPDPHMAWALKTTASALTRALLRRPSCVVTSGPPHLSHAAGWVLRRVTRTPWIADFRDLWTDDAVQTPPGPYQARLFRRLEMAVLKGADAVVTVSPSWQAHLAAKLAPVRARPEVHLVRNGHDLDATRLACLRPRKRGGPLHIHFNGVLQTGNRAPSLLDALAGLRGSVPADLMPAVTFTGLDRSFHGEIVRRDLGQHVVDVGVLPSEDSIEYAAGADVLLVSVSNLNPLYRGTIPGKLYEAMALGRHVLALVPRESDVRALLEEYGDATCCDVDDADAIARALLALIERHRSGRLTTVRARADAARERYSRETPGRQLLSLIERLTGTPSPGRGS